jgi:hypothetical protein
MRLQLGMYFSAAACMVRGALVQDIFFVIGAVPCCRTMTIAG